jgi:2-hydroxychromene-2-carboxylate isomerase
LRGITLFGTEKVWNSSLVLKAMLYCKSFGRDCLDRFQRDNAFPRLWRREINLEDPEHVRELCIAAGADMDNFDDRVLRTDGECAIQLREITKKAVEQGVFGVPTLLDDGEIFWGKVSSW